MRPSSSIPALFIHLLKRKFVHDGPGVVPSAKLKTNSRLPFSSRNFFIAVCKNGSKGASRSLFPYGSPKKPRLPVKILPCLFNPYLRGMPVEGVVPEARRFPHAEAPTERGCPAPARPWDFNVLERDWATCGWYVGTPRTPSARISRSSQTSCCPTIARRSPALPIFLAAILLVNSRTSSSSTSDIIREVMGSSLRWRP